MIYSLHDFKCFYLCLVISIFFFEISSFTIVYHNFVPIQKSKLNAFSVKSSSLDTELYPEERVVVNVFRQCGPSVGFVTSTLGGNSLGSGSCFLVGEDGYLVTNYHVIERAFTVNSRWDRIMKYSSLLPSIDKTKKPAEVKVRMNSSTKYVPARIVNVEPKLDLAILKVSNSTTDSLSVVKMGSSVSLLVGQKVVAIGNPFGLDQSVTSGVVSALDRKVTGVGGNVISNCIQTDAAINPGNSGGPLLNSKGEWIGVNTAILTTSGSNAGIGFAVPVDKVKKEVQNSIDKDRGVKMRGYLGCSLMDDSKKEKISKTLKAFQFPGALVSTVKKKSSADTAGIVIGDLIVAVNGTPIDSAKDLLNDLEKRKEGEKISLTIISLDESKRVVYLSLEKYKN